MKQFLANTAKFNNVSLEHVDNIKLQAIDKQFDNPAVVDVFVYDTSRDSDGGVWRKRTQHTSWYNEELNTTTRGSRREFPAVAVIVAETNKVTIYDGDDPDLSMWMVFTGNALINMIYGLNTNPSSISVDIVNAKLCVATKSGNPVGQCGLFIIDFINDSGYMINQSSAGPYKYNGNITQRNAALNTTAEQSYYSSIVNQECNDVAMTILPNAPVDDATGLPTPTIAVATDGGVSVIRDDGNVISTDLSTTYRIHNVDIQPNGNLFSVLSTINNSNYGVAWAKNYADISGLDWDNYTSWNSIGGFYYPYIYASSLGYIGGNVNDLSFDAIGSVEGLTKTDKSPSSFGLGMTNFITSKYNTGWMFGDIELATLSDTTVETIGVNSDELVENNKFGTGTEPTGWLTHAGTSSVVNNQAVLDGSDVTDANLITEIDCVVGRMYEFKIDSFRSSGGNSYNINVSTGSGSMFHQTVVTGVNKNNSSVETTTIQFVATETTHYVGVKCNGAPSNASVTIDNVSVRATTELITNGDFSNGDDGTWVAQNNSIISIDPGNKQLTVNATDNYGGVELDSQYLSQLIGGKTYTMVVDIDSINRGAVRFGVISGFSSGDFTTPGVHTGTFVFPEGATLSKVFVDNSNQGSNTFVINSISIRPAVYDRSVNNNDLQVIGEINKTPVAPGADLVAYSGFSANNYLVQQYNEDLDFTDTMSIMLWVKNVTGNFNPIERGTRHVDHSYGLYLKDAAGDLRFYYSVDGTTDQRVEIPGGGSLLQSGWHHVAVCVSQGIIKMYVDGKLLSTADQVGDFYSQSTNQNGLIVGKGSINPWYDEPIALLRISATAPTDAQIAKIYRDEKLLFQDGAQATLHGTSDAVAAMSHDPFTDLLHVGTSDGQSVFKGLTRVGHDDEPVTTCMSVVDQMTIKH